MTFLRDLDEKYLPGLARRVDAFVARLPKPPEPSGPLPVIVRLRLWDDRYARRGALATLREVPQLGAVAIGILLLANGVTVRSRSGPEAERANPPGASPGTSVAPEDGTLGPDLGEDVVSYISAARAKLTLLGAATPAGTAIAVVHLREYLTPAQAAELLGPVQARQVFFRVAPMPVGKTSVMNVEVEDLVKDTRAEFRRLADERTLEANRNLAFAATIEGDNPEEVAQKKESEKDAAQWLAEAKILRIRCACIFAVVVRANLRLLLDMGRVGEVRAIEPSIPDAKIEDYEFTGLLPEDKKVATGGNRG